MISCYIEITILSTSFQLTDEDFTHYIYTMSGHFKSFLKLTKQFLGEYSIMLNDTYFKN